MRMKRFCPICGTWQHGSEIFLNGSLEHSLDDYSFASRKVPEFKSLTLIKCGKCDLVYAPVPPSNEYLFPRYANAEFTSEFEERLAAGTYLSLLQEHFPFPLAGGLLEIGCGGGFFLELLSDSGVEDLHGIEPSLEAVAQARSDVRDRISNLPFEDFEFVDGGIHFVCSFMTLEHVLDPMSLLKVAHQSLASGGSFVAVSHDYSHFLNRILGRRSPIIDVEHLQLFCPEALRAALAVSGFRNVRVKHFHNRYPLTYWVQLLPLGVRVRKLLRALVRFAGLEKLIVRLKVGNLLVIAEKP